MQNSGYVDYVVDMLSLCGTVKTRKMFSGYAVYINNVCFALILNDVLYFKIQECDRSIYESYGSRPFSYEKKNGKLIEMSYWQVPQDILEDQPKLAVWVARSLRAVSMSKKVVKRPAKH